MKTVVDVEQLKSLHVEFLSNSLMFSSTWLDDKKLVKMVAVVVFAKNSSQLSYGDISLPLMSYYVAINLGWLC